MTDSPWLGDTLSLVEAFRSGERSPEEELDATLAAIEASQLNAWCYLAADEAREQARNADVSEPLGGVPIGLKMGGHVTGWPFTEASIPLREDVSSFTSTMLTRLREAGAVFVGQTTMSEFAGLNQTRTKLHGATRNPWNPERTPGGSSGGSAAAVAGGLVTMATAGDGGGSTRIPAGFCGLPGLKPNYGRIPKGPEMAMNNLTAVPGCLSRSVRDIARFFDVVSGFDRRDPFSLPIETNYEAELGTQMLSGLRVAVRADLGTAIVRPEIIDMVEAHASMLINDLGLKRVDVDVKVPRARSSGRSAGCRASASSWVSAIPIAPLTSRPPSGSVSRWPPRCSAWRPRRVSSHSAQRATRRWPRCSTRSTW